MAKPRKLSTDTIGLKNSVDAGAGDNSIAKRLSDNAKSDHIPHRGASLFFLPETITLDPVVKTDDAVSERHYIRAGTTQQTSV